MGSNPGSGRSPGGRHGNPLQYSCLENFMDRRAWKATVHRVTEMDTRSDSACIHAQTGWAASVPVQSYHTHEFKTSPFTTPLKSGVSPRFPLFFSPFSSGVDLGGGGQRVSNPARSTPWVELKLLQRQKISLI